MATLVQKDAQLSAAMKLGLILDDFLRAGETTRALKVIKALGATGSPVAVEKLAQLFDQTEDPAIEDEIIEALGEVARNASRAPAEA